MLLNTSRSRCRNPRCRQELLELVETAQQAFCSPGCRESFYFRRCVVCEGPVHCKQRTCGWRCRTVYRKNPARYHPAKGLTATTGLGQLGAKSARFSEVLTSKLKGAARGVPTDVNLI